MSDLELGLALGNDLDSRQPTDAQRRFHDLVEQVERARALGYCAISVGHHHSIGASQWLHPAVLLAALASVAGDMQICIFYAVGQYHPVEVAEQLATLDAICDGRLRITIGPGWSRPEFDALGIRYSNRLSRFIECLEVLRQLWTGEPVTFHGQHYVLDDVRLSQLPQSTEPRIWMGASTPTAARRVARLADSFVMSAHTPLSGLRKCMHAYEDELREAGKVKPQDVWLNRNCYLDATDELASTRAHIPVLKTYGEFSAHGLFDAIGDPDSGLYDRLIVGGPRSLAHRVEMMRLQLSFDRLFLRLQWPGSTQSDVLRSIELARAAL